jgi:type I restriction enzyme S subunit
VFEANGFLGALTQAAPATYCRAECAVFCKTAELWGEFSNMAAGFLLLVNGRYVRTSEALYQACRFPHLPEVQREIIDQASPMSAKMKVKPHRDNSRPDFDELRIEIMWWALRVKLACNYRAFSKILRASGERPIVEESHKDTFWGAKPRRGEEETLVGQNLLGRLLMALRERVLLHEAKELCVVEPLQIENFLLFGQPIGRVQGSP